MKILVIEDDPVIAQALKKGLQQEYFAVDVYSDGEEGYLAAVHDDYDVIVLDVLLPGMNGVEVAAKLRARAVRSRILMLSAKDQTPDKIKGLVAGADDYMVKPFSFEELLTRIKTLLRRPDAVHGETLEVHDLTLNTTTCTVTRAGQLITLSAKEFAILEYLMRNKGKVLSKNSIVTHVWDFEADVLPHTVEAFIGMLRTKIDKPFAGPAIIRTVRGFGYTISDES